MRTVSLQWPGVGKYLGILIDRNVFEHIQYNPMTLNTTIDSGIITARDFEESYTADFAFIRAEQIF